MKKKTLKKEEIQNKTTELSGAVLSILGLFFIVEHAKTFFYIFLFILSIILSIIIIKIIDDKKI